MRIETSRSVEGEYRGQACVVVTHGDQPALVWDISIYTKSRAQIEDGPGPLFEDLNAAIALLPEEQQAMLYAIYRDARAIQSQGLGVGEVTPLLQEIARRLYEVMPYERFQGWVDQHSGIRVPDGIKVVHGPDDPRDQVYLDRTYLVTDYMGLVGLGLAVRLMLPIWGEFLKAAKTYSGNANKEREGMRLLYYTSLIDCVPMKRLERYIEAFTSEVQKQGPSQASIMGGAGSTAIPEIIQSILIVRRLAVCDLVSSDGTVNVITNVYQFILFNLKGMDRKYGGKYGANITDQGDASTSREDSNDSRLELMRIKEDVPAAVGVKKNVYSHNVANMVECVDPTIPMDILQQCSKAIAVVDWKLYEYPQVFLMQSVVGSPIAKPYPAMSYRGLPLMKLESQHRAAAVTQAALWHWGFYQLAALLTAEKLPPVTDILGASDPMRFNKEAAATLMQLFPYERTQPRSKPKSRFTNVGQRVIESFTVDVRKPVWRLHAPQQLIERLPNPQAAQQYEFFSSVRDEMIQLFLKINSQ